MQRSTSVSRDAEATAASRRTTVVDAEVDRPACMLFSDDVASPSGEAPERHEVLERWKRQKNWYEHHAYRNRVLHNASQATAVILSGITPVLVAWTELPTPLKALPPAIAAIAAGLNGVFHWQRNYVRFQWTAEELKSEQFSYSTRTKHYPDRSVEDALKYFAERIEGIALTETSDWAQAALTPVARGPER
jgi:Protein of unknown function (DUF4231)